jgi:hypothetical protein
MPTPVDDADDRDDHRQGEQDLAGRRQLERFGEVVAGQREEDHDQHDVLACSSGWRGYATGMDTVAPWFGPLWAGTAGLGAGF